MSEMGNIFGWLAKTEELSILKDAQKHVEEACKTVTFFSDAVSEFIRGDEAAKAAAIENVHRSEHEADILRAKMTKELVENVLIPADREDLMRFVRTLDKIADWTNGAARILGFMEQRPPEAVLKNFASAASLTVKSVTGLRASINYLLQNKMAEALASCSEVDKVEHEADDQKKTLIESIIHAKLEPTSLLLSYQLAEYMEGVTDKIEDAADFVKVMAIKSR